MKMSCEIIQIDRENEKSPTDLYFRLQGVGVNSSYYPLSY
jgi:hypothetical protein